LCRVCPFCDDNAWWGALMCTPAFPLFRRHPLVSRRLATPTVRLSVVCPSPFEPSYRFLCVSEVFRLVFCAGHRFLPFSPEVAGFPQLQHASRLWSRWAPPECPGTRFFLRGGLATKSTARSLSACLRASFTVFSFPSSSCIFMAGSSTPSATPWLPPSLCGPRIVWVDAVGQLFVGHDGFLQGFSDTLGHQF
jgi:hypothetical protein